MNKYFPTWKKADDVILFIAENLEFNIMAGPTISSVKIGLLTEKQETLLKVIIPHEYFERFNILYEEFVREVLIDSGIYKELYDEMLLYPDNETTRFMMGTKVRQKLKEMKSYTEETLRDKFIKHMGSTFSFPENNIERELLRKQLANVNSIKSTPMQVNIDDDYIQYCRNKLAKGLGISRNILEDCIDRGLAESIIIGNRYIKLLNKEK